MGRKSRWYLPASLITDLVGAGVPVALTFFAAHQRRAVPTGIVAGLAWAGVQLFRSRYAARSIGESRGTLPVLHDWFILLGVLAVGHAAAGARLRAPLCLAALLPALVLTLLCRKAVHRHLASVRRRAQAVIKVLVVGEAAAADGVTAHLAARTDHPYVAVGAVPVGPGPFASGIRTGERLAAAQPEAPGEDANLVISAVHRLGADLVLVVPGAATSGERLRRLSWGLHDAGIELFVAPGLVEVSVKRLETGSAGGMSLLRVAPPVREGMQPLLKGILDRTIALLGLLALAPVLLVVATAVKLTSPGPVLYLHERVGRAGNPFVMWKFRTMRAGADRQKAELAADNENDGLMFKMRRDPRVTRVGHLLRRTSLDELPQLVNVLKGDMSLVGPRPPLADEVAHYTPVEWRRLSVRPGMTGLWQISGRSDLSWDETIQLDLSYVDNWSFTSDVDVMARTFRAVVDGRGAY
ncbi:exopolysaccharide biosynthesis polyprenyl glycosylphosphotransferase [Streptomyces sp. NPDC048448]|uniref:exopolysaccharide biosynthesis polyprenyl glycosylphosphotransferase n=1 Tax=unclassified Streptomyces TaxID=2593676 RepID=UPI00143E50E6|nr:MULTISPECIES: exopolysaccharide biosynthesis polyprenyl glycosylphosphotransferase [unclassified Streptomyces]QIY65216.1 exopolysaccharide biosynthesis polyprenyl glycosylphosphotransferase [Streptomyces sp. RPA4-2]